MDLLSSSQRTEIKSVFDDLHDTFKKEIKVFTKKLASYSGPSNNQNYLFDKNSPRTIAEPEYTSTSIYARVKHMDRSEIAKIPGIQSQTNIQLPEGLLRLKIQSSDYQTLVKAAKIDYGGLTYSLFSDAGKIGPFEAEYYMLYYKRSDA